MPPLPPMPLPPPPCNMKAGPSEAEPDCDVGEPAFSPTASVNKKTLSSIATVAVSIKFARVLVFEEALPLEREQTGRQMFLMRRTRQGKGGVRSKRRWGPGTILLLLLLLLLVMSMPSTLT